MSKEKSPAFQHYPKDILSDINYQMMSWAERGMYRHLIDLCWMEMSIPADPQLICRILQISLDKDFEQSTWPLLQGCFKQSEQDSSRLVHPRLEFERLRQADWKTKCAAGGRASAHKRKTKKVISPEQGSCLLLPTVFEVKPNTPSSSPSPNNKTKQSRAARQAPADFTLTAEDLEWARNERPDLDVLKATETFKDHTFKVSRSNWKATWRNWIRNERTGNGNRPQSPNGGAGSTGSGSNSSGAGNKNPRSGPEYDPSRLF